MDIVKQTSEKTNRKVEDVFADAFKGTNHFVIENHVRMYKLRGTIPIEVQRHCEYKNAEWRVR